MTCERAREQLTAYLEGELSGDRGSALRGHLRGCEACRQAAADEAALRDGLRSLPPVDPPASLWGGVQARLAAAEVADAERPAWRRLLARWTPRAPQLALGSVLVAAAIVLIVVRMQRSQDAVAVAPPLPLPTIQQTKIAASRVERAVPTKADDVTAELAAAPSRLTKEYAQAAHELEELAKQARPRWAPEQAQQFDTQLASLHRDVDHATDDRGRQRAYRAMIRYLQRAAVRDDVAFAEVAP